ncbi:NAD(P)-binding protein [Rhizodiscina lignyota]|uniref:NAD(P)-binding protein n=1 Tax=Rhizodiscina lignyota TaxID=1504668 RepID=A0A9P4IKR6_9PEZI|nr:NAD(P)-binding protein [Rhizodiscina lignyota]
MGKGPVGAFPVKGKIVAVTGGGSGIGLSFAKICHSKGARVVIGDLKLTDQGSEFVNSAKDGSVVFTKCDVTNWEDLKNVITTSVKTWDDVPDVYCPCAGIFEPPWSNFWADTEDKSYATMRINAEHPIKFTRLAFRALLGADKKGVVCLVASGAGLGGIYISALYCASKHAVVGLGRSLGLADEEEGIKVVTMCPGLVTSPLWTDRQDDKAKMFGYRSDFKEHRPDNTPDEMAAGMVKLVEDDNFGGLVYSKRPDGDQVVNKGGKQDFLDVEGHYVQDILAKERGVGWHA